MNGKAVFSHTGNVSCCSESGRYVLDRSALVMVATVRYYCRACFVHGLKSKRITPDLRENDRAAATRQDQRDQAGNCTTVYSGNGTLHKPISNL
jgi:hypothetical protein